MAWADLAETSQSTTSTLAAGIQTYENASLSSNAIDKTLLITGKPLT